MTWRPRTVIPPFVCAAALAACSGGQRPATPPGGGQPQTVATAAGTAVGNPTTTTSAQEAPGNLAGSWSLRVEGQARRGPILELAVDSLSGPTFRVRVAFLMQGNVGIEPSRFEPTVGRMDAQGTIHLTVKIPEQAEPMGEMSGVLARDTIRLRTYRWAGEDQMAGGTRWLLVKQPA